VTVELRAPSREDAAAVAELLNNLGERMYGVRDESADSVLRLWESPGVALADDVRVAFAAEEARGHAVAISLTEGERVWIEAEGEEDAVPQLFDWGLRRAEERGGRILTGAWRESNREGLFQSHGFELVRHSWKLGVDLDGSAAEPVWPEGVTVRPATEDDLPAAFETHIDAFADHWEPTKWTYEQWLHWRTQPEYDPSIWFLAFDGDELAGISLCATDDGDEHVCWIDILGVRKPWRRRGIARALLLHSFGELHQRGYRQAVLEVDAQSETGATQLYEGVGMRVLRVLDRYERK
jgi:ribosomal protein S18 acetylase RimI-like enzyme